MPRSAPKTTCRAELTEVVYSYVTARQTGHGKTVYEFTSPGTFWDQSSGDWSPSMQYAGSANCAVAGSVVNAKNTYPYAPNPNYDFERGLLTSATVYDENNNVIIKKEFAYQRTGPPQVISGIKTENLDGFTSYSKYQIYSSADNVVASEKKTTFDQNAPSGFSETSTVYSYQSSTHKNVTKTSQTGSDGTIRSSYLKYRNDYQASANGDETAKALAGMSEKHMNPVVESYQTVSRPGETEKVISGKLTKYQSVANSYLNTTMYVPSEVLDFSNNAGVGNFSPSQVNSGTSFQYNSAYRPALTFESYNRNGSASTVSDRSRSIRSWHFVNRSRMPVAVISNARQNEVVYSGFESSLGEDETTSFGCTGCNPVTDSRTGSSAVSLSPSGYIQKSLKKGNGKSYLFSCWLKPSAAGTLTLTLTSASVTRTYPLVYSASAEWAYYELPVPVTEMAAEFSIKAQPGTTVLLDDALFYPENAEVMTYTYNLSDDKLSQTTTNGIATYYEYDQAGRLRFVRDQDRNIVRKESYTAYNTSITLQTPLFSYPSVNAVDGVSIPFSVYTSVNPCLEGITYTWNFGDGTAIVTGANPSHTFVAAGTYNVTLTATHPLYGSKSISDSVNIKVKPLTVTICGSGVINVDNCHVEPPLILTCPGFPSDNRHTYFNMSSVSGCPAGTTYTYQWETSTDMLSWTAAGTGTTYSASVNTAQSYPSYWIRCKVSSNCGRSGISNIMQFVGWYSSPDCN
ncbi:PKD domain-containing protein [Arcticibacter tournemirensis]|nr:PKD domain-containing protein [Arcticibacter tournemirensis]